MEINVFSLLWIDIALGLQKLGTILENKLCTSKSKHDIKAICIQPNVSCVMEFLTCGYKINLILSKQWMVLKEINAFSILWIDIAWGL